ncbi:uncharacterized protein QC763_511150 [Podospora pseudopauciseta]|uniref:Mitochondrial transcription factor 1 n=1 Tax=Podospora pseudopauciseta TaxID=2093780 RepID=A0ABR0HAQ1_9PEZI|nr:hypothetical protein QC763_511150 [Podospora pseudopauciseta]
MLPVRHVAQATFLRSLSTRRLIGTIAAGHHRIRLPSPRLQFQEPLQVRHYARFTEDVSLEHVPLEYAPLEHAPLEHVPLERVAAEPMPKAQKQNIPTKDKPCRFACPVPTCEYATKGFTRRPNLRRHIERVHQNERAFPLKELLADIDNNPRLVYPDLEALKSEKLSKQRSGRKKVVELEAQPLPETDAEPSPKAPPLPKEDSTTASTLGKLLGALDNEKPIKRRGRPKKVRDAEPSPKAEQESQPATSGEQPKPARRRGGRPAGSKNKPKDAAKPPKEKRAYVRRSVRYDHPQPEVTFKADCVNTTYLYDALLDTGMWGRRNTAVAKQRRLEMRKHADVKRVNILSEKLCDDVLGYMKPGLLERHKGCDIIDINPGAGLWSRKLNDLLQPRKHVLVEEDYKVYEPFLKPLVEREGVEVLEVAWALWASLFDALEKKGALAAHPVRNYQPDETPERNDTLLVVMNMMTLDKKRVGGRRMGSMTAMILYQLINSVRLQGLFQKYGLVRMLIWVDEHEKAQYLPKTIQRRKAGAIQAELSLDWVTEVAGIDHPNGGKNYIYRRDKHIDMEGMGQVLERMRKAGFKVPEGRETALLKSCLELEKEGKSVKAGEQKPALAARYELGEEEWEKLKETKSKEGTWTTRDNDHLHRNTWLKTQTEKKQEFLYELLIKLDELTKLKLQVLEEEKEGKLAKAAQKKFDKLEAEIKEQWENIDPISRSKFLVARDNLRAFKQPPELGPVLMWDRRQFEPLVVQPEEFLPACDGALLDIQPRAMEPALRAKCEHGSKMFDQMDLIIRSLYLQASAPISQAVEGLWPGSGRGVAEKMRSLRDPALGGTPLKGPVGELDLRALNRTQIVELAERWWQWPFKPSFPELVGRLGEGEEENVDGENGGGATMLGHMFD